MNFLEGLKGSQGESRGRLGGPRQRRSRRTKLLQGDLEAEVQEAALRHEEAELV